MASFTRELVFLISQFLDEEKYHETAKILQQESGFFFDMKRFEHKVLGGEWGEVERYLCRFTSLDHNRVATKMFFKIRRQKYLEAVDKKDRKTAVDILVEEMKVFLSLDERFYMPLHMELRELLTLDNLRQKKEFSTYLDTESARRCTFDELSQLITENRTVFEDQWKFPVIQKSRLRVLIEQSLDWQHGLCGNHMPKPKTPTLFMNHTCKPQHVEHAPPPANSEVFSPLGHGSSALPLGGSIVSIKAPIPDAAVAAGPSRSINGTELDYQSVRNLISSVISIDFHPLQQTTLVVGTSLGDTAIWEVTSGRRVDLTTFKLWDVPMCSLGTRDAIHKSTDNVSVNQVRWSPDGMYLGVAFSKHIIHIHGYKGEIKVLTEHLEIDGHVGGVNDLAFSQPNKELHVITCGDDKTVKVWDALTGVKLYTFEGHEEPVYSICPRDNISFIFSTTVAGNVKAWTYDRQQSVIDCVAPGQGHTTMAYSADGRQFSCGTSKEGEVCVVEWKVRERKVTFNRYSTISRQSPGVVVQFDTIKNRYLAVGEHFHIKIWDMDVANISTTIKADGGLSASPKIRFNKKGSLLAVSSADNGIKILANDDGKHLLRTFENCRVSEIQSETSEHAVSEAPEGSTAADRANAAGELFVGGPDRLDTSRATVSMAGPGMDQA